MSEDLPPRPPFDEAPESQTWRKLVNHVLDEMPWRVVGAFAFLTFFFVYGAINSVIKLFGRDIASIHFPVGPVGGAVAAVIFVAWIIRAKRRLNRRRP